MRMLRDYLVYTIKYKVEYKTYPRDEDGSAIPGSQPLWLRSNETDPDACETVKILAPKYESDGGKALAIALLTSRYSDDWYRNFKIESVTKEQLDYFIEVTHK